MVMANYLCGGGNMISTLLITLGVVAFLITPKNKRCPNCNEFVNKNEKNCEYCLCNLPMVK